MGEAKEKQLVEALEKRDEVIRELKEERADMAKQLKNHENRWITPEGKRGDVNNSEIPVVLAKELACRIRSDSKLLYQATLCSKRFFSWMRNNLVATVENDIDGQETPLFRENDSLSDIPGRRRTLSYADSLLLTLMHMRTGMQQDALATNFMIDQSTVSRYLAFITASLESTIATPDNITYLILNAPGYIIKQFVASGTLRIDGTHTRVVCPSNPKKRKEMCGRTGTFTANTAVCTDMNGVIIWKSQSMPGGMHDITVLRENLEELIRIFDALRRKCGWKITVYLDKGYQGLQKDIPNAKILTPHKEYEDIPLTEEQKEHNRRVNKKRTPIEGDIHRIKLLKVIHGPFKGKLERFSAIFNVAAGIANMRKISMRKWEAVWKKYG